jgi:hypothetical protein
MRTVRKGESVPDYDEAVAEFRRLDEQIEDDRWRQAEIVWQQIQPGVVSRLTLARDLEKGHQHIGRLYRVWERFGGCASARNPSVTFEDANRMIETGKDDPEDASAVKNKNRAQSAFDQLSPEEQEELISKWQARPQPDFAAPSGL